MERGSDKHGPRIDDELAHETQGMARSGRSTHAEEWRDPEPSAEDQPDVDRAPETTLSGGVPAGMTEADVDGRSELAAYLGRSAYPATGDQLVGVAAENDAPDRVLGALRSLPADTPFQNVHDVWDALGGHVESQRF